MNLEELVRSLIYRLRLIFLSDWNLLNEALLDDEDPGGFSTEQCITPTSTDQQKPFFAGERHGSRSVQPSSVSSTHRHHSEEMKTKVNSKRKRDGLQDHVKSLEEQNKLMRRALAEYNITADELMLKQNTRLATFRRLIDVFNSGDGLQLTNFLLHITTADCLLLTPSLFQELHGRNAAIQFWTLILEAFPDGLFQLSDTAYEENGFVATRFAFTGTKVAALPSDVLLHRWGKFRDMMTALRAGVQGGGAEGGGVASSKDQAATFRDLCTSDMVPTTTAGAFLPRGESGAHGETPLRDFLPHHHAAAAAVSGGGTLAGVPSMPRIKTERSSPTAAPAPHVPADPISANVPTVRLTGYMTVTFNSMNRINRFIFVWNSASLIGQILGLSNGDLEAMSQYFNTPTAPTTSSQTNHG
jgi:hypothetical protein